MKRVLSLIFSVILLVTFTYSNALAISNTKLVSPILTKVYQHTHDPSTSPYLAFEGKLVNNTKFTAVVNSITINAYIDTGAAGGLYIAKHVFKPNKVYIGKSRFNYNLASTIKGKSSIIYQLITDDAISSSTLPYASSKDSPYNTAFYKKTTYTADITITATTTKTTKIYSKASTSGKVLKTLKTGVKLTVLDAPSSTWVKVKTGTTTGFAAISSLK